jgi:hypothetical protein
MRISLTLTAALLLILGAATPALASHNADVHTDNMSVVGQDQFPFGTDLAFKGDLVAAGAGDWDGAYPSGIYIDNISTVVPRRLSFAHCDGWHSDPDWVGRYVVQSHDTASANDTCDWNGAGKGKEGVGVFDAKQPRRPKPIGFAETIHGAHNITSVGRTGLVYVSSYNLANPADVDGVSIVDVAADPVNPPVKFLEFPDVDNRPEHEDMRNESGDAPDSMGCHDIGLDLRRDLAYCAAITETMVWDISDPRDPVIMTIIRNPAVNIHHGARPSADGNILILDDEWLGATGAGSGCAIPGAPTGALWFYDVTDPRQPQLKSFWSPPTPEPFDDFCSSHFYEAFEDSEGRDLVVSSWYEHGVYVVDFTDPSAPQEVASYDPQGANFWSAYEENGYLYAGSFAPATLLGHNEANEDKGGIWAFRLDGLSPSGK